MSDSHDLDALDFNPDDPFGEFDDLEHVKILRREETTLRGAGRMANAVLEGLENENVPTEHHQLLLKSWADAWWRAYYQPRSDDESDGDRFPTHR